MSFDAGIASGLSPREVTSLDVGRSIDLCLCWRHLLVVLMVA